MAKKPIPLPVPVIEPPEEECPKCPPPGAPAWMATFADMATLLMAFFVLILSFAEFNQPKFKMVAGSLAKSFGVQREVPVMEQPKGTTILKLEFSPSPETSITKETKQDTTDVEKPQLKQPQSEEEGEGAGSDSGEKTQQDEQQQTAQEKAAQELTEALQKALQQGNVKAETRDGEVVMTFENTADAEALSKQLTDAAQAMQKARAETGQETSEVLMAGLEDALPELAQAAETKAQSIQEGKTDVEGTRARSAAIAEAKLRVALHREVAQGLVSVEQEEDKVFITVGAGGAFPSGDADLTDEAREIMARLAFNAMNDASNIKVTGHTDDVPLNSASPYRDNWGLAAARASSVVRELSGSGLIAPDRLTAIGKGESDPVADNETEEGRAQNRRIEIEITY